MSLRTTVVLLLGSLLLAGCAVKKISSQSMLEAINEAAGTGVPGPEERIIVEAWTHITVQDVEEAAQSIRALTRSLGGKVLEDNVETFAARGSMVLRVPPTELDDVLEQLGKLGKMQQRRVKRSDVTKEFLDHEIKLENFENSLQRYREILKRAKSVEEVLQVEREMTRLRGEIEQLKGTLAYLTDRVELATITINLRADTPAVFARNAKFHPGLRISTVRLFAENAGDRTFSGPGISFHAHRSFQLDLDIMREGNGDGVDLILATIGGDVYSDFLGRGKRTWINPYVGLRVGGARLTRQFKFVVVGTVGAEIYKTEHVLVDSHLRLFTTTDENSNLALGVQPTLSVHVAF